MIETDKIEEEIKAELKDIEKRAKDAKSKEDKSAWKNSQWTKEIKKSMIKLAHNHGFKASASQCDGAAADSGEWLFDISWFKEKPDNQKRLLDELFLSMEIEWGDSNQIRIDFDKLLVARTTCRIIVFQHNNVKEFINTLIERIRAYKCSRPDDRYLFAGWNKKEKTFEIDSYINI